MTQLVKETKFIIVPSLTILQFKTHLNKSHGTAISHLYVCGAMEAADSATFGQLHKEHKDADGYLYFTYASETPSLEDHLSDSLSRYSDIPLIERYTRLDMVPLLSNSADIKPLPQSIEIPLQTHLLSPQILHQEKRNDEQIKWVAQRIKDAASRCRKQIAATNSSLQVTSTWSDFSLCCYKVLLFINTER
jgi:hypothetical protein